MPEKFHKFLNFATRSQRLNTLPTISPPGNGDPLRNSNVHFNIEMTILRLPQSRRVGCCQQKAAMQREQVNSFNASTTIYHHYSNRTVDNFKSGFP